MNFLQELSFQKDKTEKNNSNCFGPWVQSDMPKNKNILMPQFKQMHKKDEFLQNDNFLGAIKHSKKSKRQKVKIMKKVQFTQPQVEPNIQIQPRKQLQFSENNKKFSQTTNIGKDRRKSQLLNTTIYFYHYNKTQREEQGLKQWNSATNKQTTPRKRGGSQNLQKILKMKEKIRAKNQQATKKIKERSQSQRLKNQCTSLKMQGKKNFSRMSPQDIKKQRQKNQEIRVNFYSTLQSLSKQQRGTKNPLFF